MFDLGIEEADIHTHTHIQLCFQFFVYSEYIRFVVESKPEPYE